MSTTDEARTVATLQRLAAAVPESPWVPDEGAVRRRGRRIRARRWAGAAGAGLLVLALAVTVPAATTGRLALPPAGGSVTQSPRPVGAGEVAVLSPEIEAVNVPVVAGTGVLGVKRVAGWGLTVTPAAGWHLWPAWQGVDVSWVWDGGEIGGGVSYRVDDDRPAWTAPDPTSDGSPSDTYIVAGAVPANLSDPVALLSSAGGFDLGAAGTVTTVELPTFRAPTDDGRLLYAVVLRGDAARRFDASSWQMTFVGSDGTAVIPGCRDVAACAIDPLPYADLAQARVTRFAAATPAASSTASPTPPNSSESAATPAQTPPALPATTGTPAPLELAPGVLAAAGPVPGEGGFLTVGQFGGTLVRIARDGSGAGSTVGLSVISAEGGMGAEPRTTGTLGPWATVVYSAEEIFAGTRDERWFAFGTTPPDLAGARVFYDAPDGIRRADGSTVDVLELPTFTMPTMPDDPIEAGRPWFLVGFSGDALASVRGAGGSFVGHVVFAGADGTIQDPTCGFAECTDPGTAAAYGAIRSLLLTPPAVPTVS